MFGGVGYILFGHHDWYRVEFFIDRLEVITRPLAFSSELSLNQGFQFFEVITRPLVLKLSPSMKSLYLKSSMPPWLVPRRIAQTCDMCVSLSLYFLRICRIPILPLTTPFKLASATEICLNIELVIWSVLWQKHQGGRRYSDISLPGYVLN